MNKNYPIWFAPAKLNLFLHLTSQRPDGYHELQTIFQILDYGDELQFIPRQDNQFITQYQIDGIDSKNDLILKASEQLYLYAKNHGLIKGNTYYGVDIYLNKKLAMGGGLGGGSSDAASTLKALNQLWNLALDNVTLAQIGIKLGADVPVFITAKTCWAEGIGEKLSAYKIKPQHFVVLKPNIHIKTAELFTQASLKRNYTKITAHEYSFEQTENVFEALVRKKYPQVEAAFQWLEQFAEHSSPRLTGTGACLFLILSNKQQCMDILEQIPKQLEGFYALGL